MHTLAVLGLLLFFSDVETMLVGNLVTSIHHNVDVSEHPKDPSLPPKFEETLDDLKRIFPTKDPKELTTAAINEILDS